MTKMLNLQNYCEEFEPLLLTFLKNNFLKLESSWENRFKTSRKFKSDELIEYAINSCKGGKRFRPYLVYITSQNPDVKHSIDYAIAIELLHTFALVHDDVMDKSDTRRGKNSIYKEYTNMTGTDVHTGYSMGILIGDYLFSLAEESFCKSSNIQNHSEARAIYQTLKSEVILGQMLDIELDQYEDATKDEILQKTFLKTANYSVTRPMQIGLTLSKNYNQGNLNFCAEFGFNLGLGFQIQDDYLNIIENEENTGKKQYQDLLDQKQTLASWHLRKMGYNKILPQEIDSILKKTKTAEFLKEEMDKYYANALQLVQNKKEFDKLVELINFLINRRK